MTSFFRVTFSSYYFSQMYFDLLVYINGPYFRAQCHCNAESKENCTRLVNLNSLGS